MLGRLVIVVYSLRSSVEYSILRSEEMSLLPVIPVLCGPEGYRILICAIKNAVSIRRK